MRADKQTRTTRMFTSSGEGIASDVTRNADVEVQHKEVEEEYERVRSEFGASLARLTSCYESDPHAREDLLQEIRLALWIALPRFRGDSSLRTFVFRIAHNRALTYVWRRKKARPPAELPAELEDVENSCDNPEASAIRRADRLRLTEAIRLLPIPFRQVLTLALEDFPHSEIAAVLGISESNVAVRMNRARKLLREKLGSQ
jgi:RNA polymerase sigma factor (sigma-70 family)